VLVAVAVVVVVVTVTPNPANNPSYAGFLTKFSSHGSAAPYPSNTLGTQLYLSVQSQIVKPAHPGTVSTQDPTRLRKSVACCASVLALVGSKMRTSASVYATSTPSAMNEFRILASELRLGTVPTPK
jgi:hypothetical protein